jgi:hypothetical protein
MRRTLVALLVLLAPCVAGTEEFTLSATDMRGDTGLLEDFGPTGACWVGKNQLLVSDRRYTMLHLFDTEGRRFRYMEYPQKLGDANFNALCHWKADSYFVAGSHFHVKNHPRYVESRSVVLKFNLVGEQLVADPARVNYRPDQALRSSGFYGESSEQNGEITGLAFDAKHNRVFLSLSRCLAADGSVVVLEGKLDAFLARQPELELKPLKTGLKPGIDPRTGSEYNLTDLAYVPDKGLVLLLSSETNEGRNFGANQLWYLRGGFGPAHLLHKDLAAGNRGTALAVRPGPGRDEYEAVIVCDNNMEDSRIPSRMLHLRGLKLPTR